MKYFPTMTFNSFICSEITIPAVSGEEIDLYIKLIPQNEIQNAFSASAKVCYNTNLDERPTIGLIFINFARMADSVLNQYFYYSTILHEFTHLLGFSGSQASNFRNDAGDGARPTSEFIGSKCF